MTTNDPSARQGPPQFTPSANASLIDELILYARRMRASDLNIGDDHVTMEVFGRVFDVPMAILPERAEILAWTQSHLPSPEFERLNSAIGVADGAKRDVVNGNVRIHAYRALGKCRIALRLLNKDIPRFEDQNLPPIIRTFATDIESGIVLFTGKTGSGKTTTQAALIDIINREQNHHIYTIEDPVEYEHPKYPNSLISQTEVGTDVISYEEALSGVLRAAPHVMVFAELRDAESVNAALMAANSGHLVFGTLHTSECLETVQRVVNYFPPEQQTNIRFQFAQALRAAVSLRLVPLANGKGRVPACEVFINHNEATRSMLEDPEKIKQIRNAITSGRQVGMQRLEEDLTRLVRSNRVLLETARRATNHPEDVNGL